jgi:hypothetical protein
MSIVKHLCSRCGFYKDAKDFWFDKRRGKIRKPCRVCSSKKMSLDNSLRFSNSLIKKSDVENHYKGKGLPNEVVSVFSDLILLNREIKNTLKPMIKTHENIGYIFCPTCGKTEIVKMPCELLHFSNIIRIFNDLHFHNDNKGT